ncbi:helix-turn-helix transcriptional regulator [Nocardioides terrisoli]|uniref:helix-turn-helix transcriptional regulator n=1 Tax=Nocardioides terrisoli TaxID=3388267 RepID=UPI00287BA427|nr:helix-turn-helix domain-containing protein [Nocardioides marmorisolisilvae]
MTVQDREQLSVTDVCSELGIARSTFYDWRAARKAPRCIKLPNGNIRIRRGELERWLEAHEEDIP